MENYNTDLGYSPDALAERQAELLALLRQTAPEVISDNQIDIEKLKELIGQGRIAPAEHYELSWAGKANARREIQKTTSHTLLPAASNPPQAPHMLIEGENLEVLRALQKSYHGKVKMIYIDPPYNTGNDSFVYPDDYSETLDEYQKRTGEKNEAGYLNKQSLWKKNSKESGQYHSAWLSMMYPRLYLARNLLRGDGVVFISIDDNEQSNLKLLCDEVFGAENFIGLFVVNASPSGIDYGHIAKTHDYAFFYAKNIYEASTNQLTEESKEFKFKDEQGGFNIYPLYNGNVAFNPQTRPNLYYPFYLNPENNISDDFFEISLEKTVGWTEVWPVVSRKEGIPRVWRWGKVKAKSGLNTEIIGYRSESGDFRIVQKSRHTTKVIRSLVLDNEVSSRRGTGDFEKLFGGKYFPFPKSVELIRRFVEVGSSDGDIVLDFFAGSGSAAQAVMEENIKGANRQFICVQMPELLEETSEAYKAGYRTIADITRARIDKVIAKLKAENPDKTADLACAHFTLAPSNFKVWRGDVADEAVLRETLNLFQRAEKNGHSPEAAETQTAMLAELLLKHGLGALGVHAISKTVQLAGVTVHRVLMHDDKQLWLCFEPYSSALKEEISKARPAQVVLLNSCFLGDKADELLSNLQLELAGLDIGLTVI